MVLFKALGAPLAVQIVAAAAIGGALGFGVGMLTLRLRGIFFAIATVAILFIMETLMVNWRYVGGATGLQLLRPDVGAVRQHAHAVRGDGVPRRARCVGRALRPGVLDRPGPARDPRLEEAAECSGVPTLKLKLFACTVSGALMGAAGAPMPMYLSFIEPASSFSLNWGVSALAMPMIGGTAHWIGPVVGALLLGSIQQIVTVTISNEINVLVVGVLLVLFVVLAPDGIVGLFRKWTHLQVKNLSKHFGGFTALNGVSLVAQGERFGLIGPNGSARPRSSTASRARCGTTRVRSAFRAPKSRDCRRIGARASASRAASRCRGRSTA